MTLMEPMIAVNLRSDTLPEIEWEPLGRSTAELSASAVPYPAPITTFRARVPGGWLVLVMTDATHSSVTFFPDPFHEWNGGSLRAPLT